MDIVTLAAARKGGGSGGDVTKKYVDDHLALKADKVETAEYPIASTATGINPTITDSADGYVQDVNVYGRTDTVEGELHGIGEDGEVNAVTCGKNLISGYKTNIAINGSGQEETNVSSLITNKITISPTSTYVLSGEKTTSLIVIHLFDQNGNYLSYGTISFNTAFVPATFNANAAYGFVQFNQSRQGTVLPINGQLELGTTATPYEPYVSTTATVTTGIPLYSVGDVKDELDEKKGVVVKRCGIVDLGSIEFIYANSRFQSNGPVISGYGESSYTEALCDIYTMHNVPGNQMNDDSFKLYANFLYIRDDTYTDASEFSSAVSGHQIVYELAEPYEIPLTDTELSALRNLRTYASTTNVTVTDSPTVDVGYILNTDNGQAVADVQQGLQGQISNIPAWLTDIPENHKNIYRGKYLGNSVTAAQLTAIADGSFDDLYVGDYWEIPVTIDGTTVSNKWRIADFDCFLHNGTDKRHAVIVPDNTLYTAQMGGTITYGYYQSAMFTTNLNKGRTAIANAFPDMVISYEYYDIIGQTTTKYDCTVELMTLSSLTGVYSDYIHTNYLPVLPQMSLFRIMPDFIGANPNGSGHDAGFLTQTVKTSSFYWAISTTVSMMEMRTSDSYGVRPFFLLGDAGT